MNRSKSDTPREGERTSNALTGRLSEAAASRVDEARAAALRAPRTEDGTRLTRSTQISEILDRQRLLSRNRPPPPPAANNLSLADQIRERLRAPGAAPTPAATTAPRTSEYRHVPAAEHATVDISEALAKLRHDLKQDLAASFSQEIASLRQEIKEIGSAVAERGYPEDIYADLQRLAEGMEFLGEATENAVANSVRSELESLKALVDGMARQDDLALIVEHFEGLRQQMAESEARMPGKDLDARIGSLAEAIEMFVSQMSGADRDLHNQMSTFDQRLAEIAAAVDAHAQMTAELSGDGGFGSLEERVARLIEDLDAVNLPQRDDMVAQRIDTLAARIEELVKHQANEQLDSRFDELAALIKQGGSPADNDELVNIIADISTKIDEMARGTAGSDLIARFDDLVSRIDSLDVSGASAGMGEEILTWLEERMNDIAARIDSNAQAKGNPAADLGALEEQIAALTKLLSEPRVADDIGSAAISSRMTALEDYMATNDEYIVEAARQAAETALEAYVRNFSGQASEAGISQADLSMISDLASDLHALEELTRSGEERNQQTFETLQHTLVQIAERLDKLGQAPELASAPAAAKAASVARTRVSSGLRTGTEAEMFAHDFDDEDDIFDEDITGGDVGTRDGGKPIKGLLSSISKRLRSGDKEPKAEEPRRMLEPAPAIDAADDISPDLANQLLEPGSGAPDIRQILEKVRAVQNGSPKPETAASKDETGDYIAVARRAAQAAAAEMSPEGRVAEAKDGSASILGKYRRPLLLGTGLVLLAVMSWPLVNTVFVRPNPALVTKPSSVSATVPAVQQADKPAADASATAETAAPSDAVAADKTNETDAQPAPAAADAARDVTPTAPDTIAKPETGTGNDASATPAASSPAAEAPVAAASLVGPTEPPAVEPGASEAKTDNAATDQAAPATSTAPAANDAKAASDSAAPAAEAAATPAPQAAADLTVPAGIEPQALVEAAKAGDPLAVFEVGNRIFDGRGVTANPAGAIEWYNKAASLGFAPAEYRLGSIYEKGVGVSADPNKAVEHYLTAAKAGNISAMHNLAVLYATGTLGAPDFTAAAKWFTEAANHGVRDSQFNLAILYAKGSGVEQNLEQSYKWFGIAAKDGDTDAAQKRDEVGKVLTGDQLTKAKAAVDSWKVAPTDDKANATIIPDAWGGKGQKTSSVDMKKAITYIQAMLNKNGFDVGKPDGVMGAKTVAAIKQFQSSVGQQPTGDINDALVKELIARSKG